MKKEKVAIYCRVSTETQAERNTIDIQLKYAEQYIKMNNLDVYDYYIDNGVSGTIPFGERPAASKLFEDASEKKFNTIYFYKIDRLGRTLNVIINAAQRFKEMDIAIKSMTENYDTATASGELLFNMLATIAGFEKTTISERTYSGILNGAKKGNWIAGRVPFGYVKKDKTLILNTKEFAEHGQLSEAKIAELIFDLVANQGYSIIKVTEYLNQLKIPVSLPIREGEETKRWKMAKVRAMLKNPIYKGEHIFFTKSKKTKPMISYFPAIVSEELWEKAQKQIRANKPHNENNLVEKYLLRGLLRCGKCGGNYGGVIIRNVIKGKKYQLSYYQCRGKNLHIDKNNFCKRSRIDRKWLDKVVLDKCFEIIKQPSILVEDNNELDTIREKKKAEIDRQVKLFTKSFKETEKEKDSTISLCAKGLITEEELQDRLVNLKSEAKEIQDKIKSLLQNKESLNNTQANLKDTAKIINALQKSIDVKKLSWELKRKIVTTLIKKIVITKQDDSNMDKVPYNVKIFYNFSNNLFDVDKQGDGKYSEIEARQENIPLADYCKLLRKKSGYSLNGIAKRTGLPVSKIKYVETVYSNELGEKPIGTLKKLSELYAIPFEHFLAKKKSLPAKAE